MEYTNRNHALALRTLIVNDTTQYTNISIHVQNQGMQPHIDLTPVTARLIIICNNDMLIWHITV